MQYHLADVITALPSFIVKPDLRVGWFNLNSEWFADVRSHALHSSLQVLVSSTRDKHVPVVELTYLAKAIRTS